MTLAAQQPRPLVVQQLVRDHAVDTAQLHQQRSIAGPLAAAAVAILMVMHLAIALVTYDLLVHVAPVRPAPQAARRRHAGP
jgi:hypothetical protein